MKQTVITTLVPLALTASAVSQTGNHTVERQVNYPYIINMNTIQ